MKTERALRTNRNPSGINPEVTDVRKRNARSPSQLEKSATPTLKEGKEDLGDTEGGQSQVTRSARTVASKSFVNKLKKFNQSNLEATLKKGAIRVDRKPDAPRIEQLDVLDGVQIHPTDIEEEVYARQGRQGLEKKWNTHLLDPASRNSIQYDVSHTQKHSIAPPFSVVHSSAAGGNVSSAVELSRRKEMKTFVENEAFGGFSKMPANMTSVDIPSDNRQKRNSTLELTGSVRAERQHSMSPLKTEITSLGGARAKDLRGFLKAMMFLMVAASGMLVGCTMLTLIIFSTRESNTIFLSIYSSFAVEYSTMNTVLSATLATMSLGLVLKGRHEHGGWTRMPQAEKARSSVLLIGYSISLLCALITVPIAEHVLANFENDSLWYEDASKRHGVDLKSWTALAIVGLASNLFCWVITLEELSSFSKRRHRIVTHEVDSRVKTSKKAWNAGGR
ncbi:hypothetical protein AAMO2058_000184200 [Amorphochlora amoebiformis]